MLCFCLQCLCSSSLFCLWFLPWSFHCHCHLFYHCLYTFGYLISTLSHFWRLELRFTLSVKFQIHNFETWVLRANHQSSNAKLHVMRVELREPITNCQTLNFKCWGLSFESQSLITNHQCQGSKLDAKVRNSYSLWGLTYLFGAPSSILLIVLFVLRNSLSEVRVSRTNHKSPNAPPKRWWTSSKALINSEVRCTLSGLGFQAHLFYCLVLLDNPSKVQVPRPDTNYQLPHITL